MRNAGLASSVMVMVVVMMMVMIILRDLSSLRRLSRWRFSKPRVVGL